MSTPGAERSSPATRDGPDVASPPISSAPDGAFFPADASVDAFAFEERLSEGAIAARASRVPCSVSTPKSSAAVLACRDASSRAQSSVIGTVQAASHALATACMKPSASSVLTEAAFASDTRAKAGAQPPSLAAVAATGATHGASAGRGTPSGRRPTTASYRQCFRRLSADWREATSATSPQEQVCAKRQNPPPARKLLPTAALILTPHGLRQDGPHGGGRLPRALQQVPCVPRLRQAQGFVLNGEVQRAHVAVQTVQEAAFHRAEEPSRGHEHRQRACRPAPHSERLLRHDRRHLRAAGEGAGVGGGAARGLGVRAVQLPGHAEQVLHPRREAWARRSVHLDGVFLVDDVDRTRLRQIFSQLRQSREKVGRVVQLGRYGRRLALVQSVAIWRGQRLVASHGREDEGRLQRGDCVLLQRALTSAPCQDPVHRIGQLLRGGMRRVGSWPMGVLSVGILVLKGAVQDGVGVDVPEPLVGEVHAHALNVHVAIRGDQIADSMRLSRGFHERTWVRLPVKCSLVFGIRSNRTAQFVDPGNQLGGAAEVRPQTRREVISQLAEPLLMLRCHKVFVDVTGAVRQLQLRRLAHAVGISERPESDLTGGLEDMCHHSSSPPRALALLAVRLLHHA
eukprot:scaffold334_cov241-Pinguiococcus_pyrenoidosus.AAC.2